MTVSDITQARDEILGTFRTAWLADPISQDAPIFYWDRPDAEPPSSGSWCRITVRHARGEQATLSGETGQREFEHGGLVTVQIFAESGEGGTESDQLAAIAKNSFEGVTTSPGRVLFRNVRFNEVGQDGQWFQINVLADFEYDEVR